MASPGNEPTVETVDELVAYMASGCKPKDQWRLGTEHEKFGFYLYFNILKILMKAPYMN